MRIRFLAVAVAAASVAVAATLAGAAPRSPKRHAEIDHESEREHEREEGRDRGSGHGLPGRFGPGVEILPAYAKECGSCHVAYPAHLLPAASWRAVLSGLDRHFGQNAELEPEVRAEIEGWLVDRAAPPRRSEGEAPLRITRLRWFLDEHDEVPAAVVARRSVGSMANCAACHPGASGWDFDGDRAKIPSR